MKRRLKKARIKFLSLCPKGANKMPTILKSDGAFEVSLLSKGMDERGELNAIVYAPEFRDVQGDIASAEVIKDMAYAAARDGVEIDVRHNNKPVGRDRAFVAEHFIVQKGDPRFHGLVDYNGVSVDPTGAWGVVVKIEDPELRDLYKGGGWQGISMAGTAEIEHEKEDPTDRVIDLLIKRLDAKTNSEEDMPLSAEDLKKIEESTTAIVTKAIEVAFKKEDPKPADPAPEAEAPVFKGDPTKAEDVAKHLTALKRFELEKSVDWTDPTSVAAHGEALAELAKEGEPGEDENQAEIEKLQAKITKLQSTSRQGGGEGPKPTTPDNKFMTVEGLAKEEHDDLEACLAAGRAMAIAANSRRGFSRS